MPSYKGAESHGNVGIPMESDVWGSTEYSESFFLVGNTPMIDARGKTAKGTYWRDLGRLGESAYYRDVDEPVARILDKMLDGGCLLPDKH